MRIPHWAIQSIAIVAIPASGMANVSLRMQTDLGSVDLELLDTAAPLTYANFMNYVSRGSAGGYDGTFIHRSVPDFVLQGGGYIFNPDDGDFFGSGTTHIPEDPPILNDPDPVNRPNIRGTLAMAKIPATDPDGNPIPGGGKDSATSQWFFNLKDNPGLDDPANNGGYTVFGRVLGNGMGIIDAIAAQLVCDDILPGTCGQFPAVPIIGNDGTEAIQPKHLAIVNHIGFDQDGDGAIDSLEDAAPNAGDGNGDGVLDSTQNFVASFPGSADDYVVLETPAANPIHSLDILGITYGLANRPAFKGFFDALDFRHGFTGFNITQLANPAVTVTQTLKAGETPDTYWLFGPTPDDQNPHWYEFLFDGRTGAKITGNVITLHFMDGERGDTNIGNPDGVVLASPGGPAVILDTDGDGIIDTIEDAAPNGGDANNDGTLDSIQGHVASFPDVFNSYITLETAATTPLDSVFVSRSDPGPGLSDGINFGSGFISFGISGAAPGGSTTAKLTLAAGSNPNAYYIFGPTPDNNTPHWYAFSFDAASGIGAGINGNVITLNLVDGARGDSDLDNTNGRIVVSEGGPAFVADFDALDIDGDGAPDTIEKGGPNGGDSNNDGVLDSEQRHVASFTDVKGLYLSLVTDPSLSFELVEALGEDFLQLAPPNATMDGYDFIHGFLRFKITNITPGDKVTAHLVLPEDESPASYFNFGPTPANNIPDWYKFLFDGNTGAVISDNVITLNFIDGDRGDADLTMNGVIINPGSAPGFLATDTDGDGIIDAIEDAAPNGGDANNDGIIDSLQGHVASFPDAKGLYLSLVTDQSLSFELVEALGADFLLLAPPNATMAGNNFIHGFLRFKITNITPGDKVTAHLILPEDESPASYFNFGPTPANNIPDWYKFLFDGNTGAVISDNVITLNFIDGDRGDADLTMNGVIINPGSAPGLLASISGPGGGGGGCTLGARNSRGHHAIDWWLVLAAITVLGSRIGLSRNKECASKRASTVG